MAATAPATFLIFLEFHARQRYHIDEFQIENAATGEVLNIRSAWMNLIVKILRHPIGAAADDKMMREWKRNGPYFEEVDKKDSCWEEQVISIGDFPLTIG